MTRTTLGTIALLGLLGTGLPARAAVPVIESAEVTPQQLFANSLEGSRVRGEAGFRGRAPGAKTVEIRIADDLPTPGSIVASAAVWPQDEPGDGFKAGDFLGSVNVTGLGRHRVDPELVNRRPGVNLPGDRTAVPGEPLAFTVSGDDLDGDPVALGAWALPAGAVFDPAAGELSWTPQGADAGTHTVVFTASDGRGGVAAGTVSIAVGEPSTNGRPAVTAPRSKSLQTGSSVSFAVTGSDPDGDAVTLGAPLLPEGATFANGTFAWTPAPSQAGTVDVPFVATDGNGGAAVAPTQITVIDLARLGAGTLTFTFQAVSASGERSEPVVRTIRKYAGTPGDTYIPVTRTGKRATTHDDRDSEATGPPLQWCHVIATMDGACAIAVSGTQIATPWFADTRLRPPTGVAQVSGAADDLTSSSLGLASEISDVVLRVFDFRLQLVTERRSFIRRGPAAFFAVNVYINDYEPNLPGQPYRWEVSAIDAWGNEADLAIGVFNVNPY